MYSAQHVYTYTYSLYFQYVGMYTVLWLQGNIAEQAQHQLSGLENWHITQTAATYTDHYKEQHDSLVYLTADSPNELSSLDPVKKYIIGGIVDRNRHKNICFKKAEAQVCFSTQLCGLLTTEL